MQVVRGLVIDPEIQFVDTPYFQALIDRSLAYLRAGIPVHFQGHAGIGKTTCALHLANALGRPAVVIFGSDEFTPADLLGRHFGYRRKLTIDQYIHSVERRSEEVSADWVDGRLLAACKEGFTLVYDEFSRSRPETNNLLLSVLEEGVLELPTTYQGEKYLRVHPEFRAIFTSNPGEYAGVHGRPNALLDRMITLDLSSVDEDSEVAIVRAKTGLPLSEAMNVVSTVRNVLNQKRKGHSIRASLMIAKVLKTTGRDAIPGDPFFDQLCHDVLGVRQKAAKA
jgi:nitric oxide reductase NorQ protein